MRKIISISLLFLIFSSCSTTGVLVKTDCSHLSMSELPVTCNGLICQSDTCNTYFKIWKEIFLSKNQMTESYFDNHISICNMAIYQYANQGAQFEVAYKLTIDWFEVKFEGGFMILLYPTYLQNNPTVNLPSNILLSKDQINTNIDNPFFSNPFHKISSIIHLNYSTRQKALKVLSDAAGVYDLCESGLSIQYQNIDNLPIGNPVLTASATLNWAENRCVSGTMDLATGYFKVENNACVINFCFTEGTKITQNNNQTKSIEEIQVGDTILSVNTKTWEIDTDIVKQIDSTEHSDIIHISFNDKTENNNTSDHPYYVKNKGWCSFNPIQTEQKYNIKAQRLQIGDTCYKCKNRQLIEVQIKNIEQKPREVMTYNISRLERNKSYFANGILVSNEKK